MKYLKKMTLLLLGAYLSLIAVDLQAQIIQYDLDANDVELRPKDRQLYARNSVDEASVQIKGKMTGVAFNSVELRVSKWNVEDGTVTTSESQTPQSTAPHEFDFSYDIQAGLNNYTFQLYFRHGGTIIHWETIADKVLCGDVYVVSGQSNAVSQGCKDTDAATVDDDYGSFYSRSFGNRSKNSTSPDYNWHFSKAESSDPYNDLGHVGTWALKLQKQILEEHQMPTCIINGGIGGTTISQHQLTDHTYNTNYFNQLKERIVQANVNGRVKGIIWYQGESDGGMREADYRDSLDLLINTWNDAWNKDLTTGQMKGKVYIVQIHTGCYTGKLDVREAQRSYNYKFDASQVIVRDKIEVLAANGIGNRPPPPDKCHFDCNAYLNLADRIFNLISRDFYCSNKIVGINSPNIQNAYRQDATTLVLEFDQALASYPQGLGLLFFLDYNPSIQSSTATSGTIMGHRLYLTFNNITATSTITYLSDGDPSIWLKNKAGNAAFSFYNFPIGAAPYSNNNYDYQLPLSVTTNLDVREKYITNGSPTSIVAGVSVELRAQNMILFRPDITISAGANMLAYISSPEDCTTEPVYRIAVPRNSEASTIAKNSLSQEQIRNANSYNSMENFGNTLNEPMHIYPNPAQAVISIDFEISENSSNNFIKIFNLQGQLINTIEIEAFSNSLNLDVSTFPQGAYMIVLLNDDGRISTQRFIKQ